MPAAHLTDVQVDIWNLLDGGREAEARALFNRMLPLLNFEQMYAVAAYKDIGDLAISGRQVFAAAIDRNDAA